MKIVKLPYCSQKLSDFDEIWYTTADIEPDYNHVTKKLKFKKFKMADGRRVENHFLAITRQQIVRFQQTLYEWHADKGHVTKLPISKTEDGRWPPF